MKQTSRWLTFCFIALIAWLSIFNLFRSDVTFSEQENRYLAQKPTLTFQSVMNGTYMKDFETYVSEQFIGKNIWVTIKANMEKLLFKQETEDVYIGDDDYLFEKFSYPGEKWERNLQFVEEFSKGRSVHVLLAPTSSAIYKEKLPTFAPIYSQKQLLEDAVEKLHGSVDVIDVFAALEKHKDESIYFRTDHHWTMRGAYYAYVQVAKSLDITPYPIDAFEKTMVSDEFLGTYASKALGYHVQADEVELFTPTFPVQYMMRYNDEEKSQDSLYNWDALQVRDKYRFFLGANEPLVNIQSDVASSRKLAVIKDSYAHVMIPFLANHYSEIHMIDLRYFGVNIQTYLDENDLDEVLILYNIPNFTKDAQLFWLKTVSKN